MNAILHIYIYIYISIRPLIISICSADNYKTWVCGNVEIVVHGGACSYFNAYIHLKCKHAVLGTHARCLGCLLGTPS